MNDKKKYHIFLTNAKTKEQKLVVCELDTFAEAASRAYNESRKLFDQTNLTWEIVSIYNVNYNFDLAIQLT